MSIYHPFLSLLPALVQPDSRQKQKVSVSVSLDMVSRTLQEAAQNKIVGSSSSSSFDDEDVEGFFEDALLSLFDHRPVAFSTSKPGEPYIYHPPSSSTSSSTSAPASSSVAFPSSISIPDHRPITLYLPVAPSALHSTLQLTHIWLSSIFISDLIFSNRISVAGKRVAELGAGAGLPSVSAMRCGAKEVVSTDYDVKVEDDVSSNSNRKELGCLKGKQDLEDVIGVLRNNLRLNCDNLLMESGREVDATGQRKNWQVLGHTWGEDVSGILAAPAKPTTATNEHPTSITPALDDIRLTQSITTNDTAHDTTSITTTANASSPSSPSPSNTSDSSNTFDVLLLADLLWSSHAHTSLITSLSHLLTPYTGVAHVMAGLHQGRGAVERFKVAWRDAGKDNWVEDVEEVRWAKEGGWEVYEGGKQKQEGGGEERGVVVWFTIGKGKKLEA